MNEIFVARQPIFDRQEQVWGYKLLYRSSQEAVNADTSDPEASTIKVAASLTVSPDHGFRDSFFVINATRKFITSGYAQALASNRLVLCAGVEVYQDPDVQKALDSLRQEEVRLALSLNDRIAWTEIGTQGFDILVMPWAVCATHGTEWIKAPRPQVLVSGIETHDQAEKACQAGVDLLQGLYFQHPRIYSVRALATPLVNRLKMLQILESEEQDIAELTQAVEADVSVAHKLLTFVNSPAFSMVRRIESVRHAIALVGMVRLKHWLHLIIISDSVPSEQTQELAYASAVRGKFLELLALYTGRQELADTLYLLGLFSLLDAMLKKPFEEIFQELQLRKDLEAALLGHSGGLRPWLDLVGILESGDWLQMDAYAMELGVDLKTISKSKLEAMHWANTFFSFVG